MHELYAHKLCTVRVHAQVDKEALGAGARCAHTLSPYCIHCMYILHVNSECVHTARVHVACVHAVCVHIMCVHVAVTLTIHMVSAHSGQSSENQGWL